MKLKNHTDIPTETIRAIIRAVRPSGIGNFDVRISNTARGCAGASYGNGSAYHSTAAPFIVVRIARTESAIREHIAKRTGGYLPMAIGSRLEALVIVIAHELRHQWQARGSLDNRRRVIKPRNGMVYGARGRFSERDADTYALQMLRRFRRGELDIQTEGAR